MIEVYPVEEITKEEATILKTVERCADELRKRLELEDCDEAIHIYVSRKTGIITFDINNETYVDEGEGWELCQTIC
jgi:hypothetical protein